MKLITAKDYEQMSDIAAQIMLSAVKSDPSAVLGLATGTTPLGLYKRMIDDRKINGTSYKNIRSVNLDEYKGLDGAHNQSYAYFMRANLFDFIDIDKNNTYIENGVAADEKEECKRYDALLEKLPRDIQLLGLGSNGHIAFNEPGTPFDSTTHVVTLAESTVRDNARLFNDISEVPRKAFTMGLKSIMQAKRVLILASGANKAVAVQRLLDGEVTEALPASILNDHPDCTLVADLAALGKR